MERPVKVEKELSKRLNDSSDSLQERIEDSHMHRSNQVSGRGDLGPHKNIHPPDKETGEAGMKEEDKNMDTITSGKEESGVENDSSESFIPFSQRTSMTHAPTIYEELIQKYEGDIRNHIRIEQQMKLHSDSVLNKLEDKEKEYDKTRSRLKQQENVYKEAESKLRIEMKILKEENEALKKALEKKIERILTLESNVKEATSNYVHLEREFAALKRRIEEGGLTPRRSEGSTRPKALSKTKYKANSANPNSGRKNTCDSVQLFYSRNIAGPNNMGREEFVIPATSTRSPSKVASNPIITKSIMLKRDGKSPYIHADLEKLKQYVNMPKSKTHKRSKSQTFKGNPKTRKAVKSALRAENLGTDETADDSNHKIKDYNSMQNSIIYRGSKKNVVVGKSNKVKRLLKKKNTSKHQHFMSYDAHSSLSRYDMTSQHGLMDSSMDKIHKNNKKLVRYFS